MVSNVFIKCFLWFLMLYRMFLVVSNDFIECFLWFIVILCLMVYVGCVESRWDELIISVGLDSAKIGNPGFRNYQNTVPRKSVISPYLFIDYIYIYIYIYILYINTLGFVSAACIQAAVTCLSASPGDALKRVTAA